jgi:sugar lactone lactonase YvrE
LFIPDVTIPIDILFHVDATSGPILTVIIPAHVPVLAAAITISTEHAPSPKSPKSPITPKTPKTPKSPKTPKTPRGIIETIAGTGISGYSGDGGQAVGAQVAFPNDVFVDETGRVFVADTGNEVIRMVDTDGIITTIAGIGGDNGFSGDNGLAVSARLNLPQGVSVDQIGRVFIADRNNQRIRRITYGIITTIAGVGITGFAGDGGPAVDARLRAPIGVFVDKTGRIFIADTNNHVIRMIDTNGIITTIAGIGGDSGFSGDDGPASSAKLDKPQGVFVDFTGKVFIADTGNNVVRMVNTNGIITRIAGTGSAGYTGDNGPALSAQLDGPTGLSVDQTGRVLIADTDNHVIRMVSIDGKISTVAGTGSRGFNGDGIPATSAQLSIPKGVSVDNNGGVFIADTGNHRIRMFPL